MGQLDNDLSHVYWIGGSGCAGKSTVADILAKEHHFVVYHCDEHWDDHTSRATTARHPTMCTLRNMELEAFFSLPPKQYNQVCLAYFAEDFEMILDDLHGLPRHKIIVEGVSVLPRLVADIADPRQIIFMVAHEGFQRKRYLRRQFASQWFQEFSNPQATFDNLMTANGILAHELGEDADELGLRVMIVDEDRSLQDNAGIVEQHFGLMRT